MQARLVTYNVQGLGARQGVMPAPGPAQDERLKALGDTLKELDGDVVSLQEVPSKSALENFVKQEGLAEQYPHRRFFQTNDEKGANHLAVLSKHPILESKSNKDKRFKVDGKADAYKFTRDVAEVKVNLGGYPLRVYNTHLKANPQISRRDPSFESSKAFTDELRNGEARALKGIIKDNYRRSPSEHFVITMDANATPDNAAISRLTTGLAPAHDPLADQAGFATHPSSNRRLDYILLSDGLNGHYVPGSAQVPNSSRTRRGSDHNPEVLTIELPDLPRV